MQGTIPRGINRVMKNGAGGEKLRLTPIASVGKSGVAGYFFDEAYPSAYHPPPFSSKLHAESIFLALALQLEHSTVLVSIRTSSSVI
jgi:hypothetical protein